MKGSTYTGLWSPSKARRFAGVACLAMRLTRAAVAALCVSPGIALAVGTGAGVPIPNSVTLDYVQSGASRRATSLSTFYVDELLEVSLVNANASTVGVVAGQSAAVQQYTLTNLGNGVEAFRISAEPAIGGDNFDPDLNTIYLETNATPGLQLGVGGDEVYVAGTNDPLLTPDESLSIYVTADIPTGVNVDDFALLELRAIAVTIVTAAGTDDPTQPGFPAVGDVYSDLGDPRSAAAGAVDAMVGLSYDIANSLYADRHDYRVNDVGLAITKTAFDVADPSGGNTIVPGSVVSYRVLVELVGGGSAQSLVITDPMPQDLRYAPNSLSVVGLPAGENADDDLVPAGVDNTGINGDTLEVTFGDVAGPVSLTIEYQAIVQ